MRRLLLATVILASFSGGPTQAKTQRLPLPSLGDTVGGILQAHCVRCHGPDEQSGGLRLDDYDAVLRGGDSGPAIIPGNARDSLLLRKVLGRDRPAMPPRKVLALPQSRAIRAWIEAGAPR